MLLYGEPDLVPGQTEDDGGAFTGPVDHQVQVRVVKVKYRAARTRGFISGGEGAARTRGLRRQEQ